MLRETGGQVAVVRHPRSGDSSEEASEQDDTLAHALLDTHGEVHDMRRGARGQARHRLSDHEYTVEAVLSSGHHGQVFRAVRLDDPAAEPTFQADRGRDELGFVLKRLFPGKPGARASGLREVFFGQVLRSPAFARFVEHWFSGGPAACAGEAECSRVRGDQAQQQELWLVFRDEGVSLQSLLFDVLPTSAAAGAAPSPNSQLEMRPSAFFTRLHADLSRGAVVVAQLLRQLLAGLAELHDRRILHRDIKPANLLVSVSDGGMRVRLADFGSAVALDVPSLYPGLRTGEQALPSQAEETLDYAPPEVRLTSGEEMELPYDPAHPFAYDVWSLGMVLLEVVAGEPAAHMLVPLDREQALIAARFGSLSSKSARVALYLAGLRRLCIAPPAQGGTDTVEHAGDSHTACTLEEFRHALRRLVWRKHWRVLAEQGRAMRMRQPEDRPAADSALVPASHVPTYNAALVGGDAGTEPPARGLVGGSPSALERLKATSPLAIAAPEFVAALSGGGGLVPVQTSDALRRKESASMQLARAEDLHRLYNELVASHFGLPTPVPHSPAASAALQESPSPEDAACLADEPPEPVDASAACGDEGRPVDARECPDSAEHTSRQARGTCTVGKPTPLLGALGEELLYAMLAWRPSERITAGAARRHPFFEGAASNAHAGER
jgi:serine/threonine protein kinase